MGSLNMTSNTNENTPSTSPDQVQTHPDQVLKTPNEVQKEVAPDIKSEENKVNWKIFREQREAERKAAQEAAARAAQKEAEAAALKAALEAITNKPSNNRQMNEYDSQDIEESEEARIDKRVDAKIKEREAAYERERLEREEKEIPSRIISTFPDFNSVCSQENLDYLDYHHSDITRPYQKIPYSYEKMVSIYKLVKKLVPNNDSKQDAAKIDKNLQKPGSISSTGNTQGGNAMPSARLDEARKAANWERMQRSLKGLSS